MRQSGGDIIFMAPELGPQLSRIRIDHQQRGIVPDVGVGEDTVSMTVRPKFRWKTPLHVDSIGRQWLTSLRSMSQ
jgi:hypothetical protein